MEVDEEAVSVPLRAKLHALERLGQGVHGRAAHHVAHADAPTQRLEVAFGDHLAFAEHADARAEALELGELVAREHRDALLAGEVLQQRAQLGDALGVEPVGGLVEQQQPRLAEHRLRDPEALAHAHGEGADASVDRGGQADGLDDALHLGVGGWPRDPWSRASARRLWRAERWRW